jgi:hypothetical protein
MKLKKPDAEIAVMPLVPMGRTTYYGLQVIESWVV